jgi:ATP-binding cassette subfamily G (WHITE) protein 2 (PDR)
MGAMSKTSEGSQPPGAVLSMLLMLYSGFVVPFGDMRPWLKWFSYINLVYYGFESLVINEFSGRSFPCALYVPDYPESTLEQKASKAVRSTPGSDFVLGDADMYETWGYRLSHLWRNLGIMMVLMFLYGAAFIICSELVSLQPSRGEILLCREKDTASRIPPSDEESDSSALVPRQGLDQVREKSEVYVAVHMAESDAATFVWKTLTYTIKVGKTEKKTLEDMEGSLMPQTMTALVVRFNEFVDGVDISSANKQTRAHLVQAKRHYSMSSPTVRQLV